MSTVYSLDPVTTGKVVAYTSLGMLEIELFCNEAPMATRNFLGLCLERYYDGVVFHRLVKDFIVQGGDRSGTGLGKDRFLDASVDFHNEVHSRLTFRNRGMIATTGDCGDGNHSQFFVTLTPNTMLDRNQHTIFGKVVGESIYNLIKVNDFEVGGEDNETLLFPPVIERIEVVVNPFPDLRPRPSVDWRATGRDATAPKKRKRRKKKQLSLLSFGEEGEEDLVGAEEGGNTIKIGSIFESAGSIQVAPVRASQPKRKQHKQPVVEEKEKKKKEEEEEKAETVVQEDPQADAPGKNPKKAKRKKKKDKKKGKKKRVGKLRLKNVDISKIEPPSKDEI